MGGRGQSSWPVALVVMLGIFVCVKLLYWY